jgi:exodeoxyribonuclease III
MKIVSWNVNGIRTRIVDIHNGVIVSGSIHKIIQTEDPDIICFQETRCSVENSMKFGNTSYPFQYFNESKGQGARGPNRYSGTSVWSKIEPINVIYNIPGYEDLYGRIIILTFDNFTVINVYTPNSGTNFANRILWNNAFLEYLKNREGRIVFCGDMNVAYLPQDTYFDSKKIKPMAGILPEEIDFVTKLLEFGFVDTSDAGKFTWWNPMCKKENGMSIMRNRDTGWRIDHFFVKGIMGFTRVLKHIGEEYAGISPLSSDHAPIILDAHLNFTTEP